MSCRSSFSGGGKCPEASPGGSQRSGSIWERSCLTCSFTWCDWRTFVGWTWGEQCCRSWRRMRRSIPRQSAGKLLAVSAGDAFTHNQLRSATGENWLKDTRGASRTYIALTGMHCLHPICTRCTEGDYVGPGSHATRWVFFEAWSVHEEAALVDATVFLNETSGFLVQGLFAEVHGLPITSQEWGPNVHCPSCSHKRGSSPLLASNTDCMR